MRSSSGIKSTPSQFFHAMLFRVSVKIVLCFLLRAMPRKDADSVPAQSSRLQIESLVQPASDRRLDGKSPSAFVLIDFHHKSPQSFGYSSLMEHPCSSNGHPAQLMDVRPYQSFSLRQNILHVISTSSAPRTACHLTSSMFLRKSAICSWFPDQSSEKSLPKASRIEFSISLIAFPPIFRTFLSS